MLIHNRCSSRGCVVPKTNHCKYIQQLASYRKVLCFSTYPTSLQEIGDNSQRLLQNQPNKCASKLSSFSISSQLQRVLVANIRERWHRGNDDHEEKNYHALLQAQWYCETPFASCIFNKWAPTSGPEQLNISHACCAPFESWMILYPSGGYTTRLIMPPCQANQFIRISWAPYLAVIQQEKWADNTKSTRSYRKSSKAYSYKEATMKIFATSIPFLVLAFFQQNGAADADAVPGK